MRYFDSNVTGANATPFPDNGETELESTYGILDKLQCKLCEQAMKLVEREVSRDSSKVNWFYLN